MERSNTLALGSLEFTIDRDGDLEISHEDFTKWVQRDHIPALRDFLNNRASQADTSGEHRG
jgi:hypothetical protein